MLSCTPTTLRKTCGDFRGGRRRRLSRPLRRHLRRRYGCPLQRVFRCTQYGGAFTCTGFIQLHEQLLSSHTDIFHIQSWAQLEVAKLKLLLTLPWSRLLCRGLHHTYRWRISRFPYRFMWPLSNNWCPMSDILELFSLGVGVKSKGATKASITPIPVTYQLTRNIIQAMGSF